MKLNETNLAANAHAINARNKEMSHIIDSIEPSDVMYKALLLHDWTAVLAILNRDNSKYSDVSTFMQKYF